MTRIWAPTQTVWSGRIMLSVGLGFRPRRVKWAESWPSRSDEWSVHYMCISSSLGILPRPVRSPATCSSSSSTSDRFSCGCTIGGRWSDTQQTRETPQVRRETQKNFCACREVRRASFCIMKAYKLLKWVVGRFRRSRNTTSVSETLGFEFSPV